MGSARLRAVRTAGDNEQESTISNEAGGQVENPAPSKIGGIGGRLFDKGQEEKAAKEAADAKMKEAEQAAAKKTAELANSAGGGASGHGSASYTAGQVGAQPQDDVDLSTSDTTSRRRSGYRRDVGISI